MNIDTDSLNYFPLWYYRNPSKLGLKKAQQSSVDEEKTFHIDNHFNYYRQVKLDGRKERLSKYYQKTSPPPFKVIKLIIEKLCIEHPKLFHFNKNQLTCNLTKETLFFDQEFNFIQNKSTTNIEYLDGFDALAMQIQEDIAIQKIDLDNQKDFASHISLFFPNAWSPEEEIGNSFAQIHSHILDYKKLFPIPFKIVATMAKNPNTLYRLGSTNLRLCHKLNHHPEYYRENIREKTFQTSEPNIFLRFERQTVTGIPEINNFLFTIRTYIKKISPENLTNTQWREFKEMVLDENNQHLPRLPFWKYNSQALKQWVKQ